MTISAVSQLHSDAGSKFKIWKNEIYKKEQFLDFAFIPTSEETWSISGVTFIDCEVIKGTCIFQSQLSLSDIYFENFRCGDAVHISSSVKIENTVFIGGEMSSMLWLRDIEETPEAEQCNLNAPQLDIRNFFAEVSITDVDVSFITIDPCKHIVVDETWLKEIDWNIKGLSLTSYWRILARKVKASRSHKGVFSIPLGERRSKLLEELNLIREQLD